MKSKVEFVSNEENGIFLLANGGKVWVFRGISRGKVRGMEWGQGPMPKAWGETPFHPEDFPKGNPEENPHLPDIG